MKAVILTICLLAFFIHGSRALSCVPCDQVQCPFLDPDSCDYGCGKDVCNCCDKCLQGPGDPCGGPWNISGICGNGLMCEFDTEVGTPNESGTCIPTGFPPFCQEVCDNCADPSYPVDQCLADIDALPGNSCQACNPSIGASCGTGTGTLYGDPCPEPLVCNFVGFCYPPSGPNPGQGIPPFCDAICDNCDDPTYPIDQCLADIAAAPGNSCHACNPSYGTACSTAYNDCPSPLVCTCNDNGMCVSPCDCTGVVCTTCVTLDQAGDCECCDICAECSNDWQCGQGETCENGVCVPICDIDCTGIFCVACAYESPIVPCTCCPPCLPPPGGEGTPCSDDGMCAYGFHCYMHLSFDGCDIDGICVSDGTPTGVCGDCDSSSCWQMSDCYFGFDWDYCGCCQVCCMGPGEHCGGPNNIYGICGVGFHCVPYDNSWDGYGFCDC